MAPVKPLYFVFQVQRTVIFVAQRTHDLYSGVAHRNICIHRETINSTEYYSGVLQLKVNPGARFYQYLAALQPVTRESYPVMAPVKPLYFVFKVQRTVIFVAQRTHDLYSGAAHRNICIHRETINSTEYYSGELQLKVNPGTRFYQYLAALQPVTRESYPVMAPVKPLYFVFQVQRTEIFVVWRTRTLYFRCVAP